MAKPRPSDAPREVEFYENLAARLDLAITAIGLPRKEIATALGISQSRLSNWTTQQNRPDWFGVAQFCRKFGVSADWLFFGDPSGLKHSLAVRLESAEAERSAAAPASAGREPESLVVVTASKPPKRHATEPIRNKIRTPRKVHL